jgi:molecular chaperone GrpE
MKKKDSFTEEQKPEEGLQKEAQQAGTGEQSASASPELSAEEATGTSGANPSIEEQLQAAREESRQNQERYLRAVADWENYRRRATREKDELRQYATSSLVEEFLPVLDNLTLGLQSAANHPEAANVAQGFQMVADQIRAILERNGLVELNPQGEAFDPHQHESLTQQPHDEIPEGHVVQVIRKGYSLNGRLLRPASVLVSSGPATTSS